ncbi:hypothetical protein FS842_001575 [Serendipita sp. 407]|nr:hypothetical protein FRC20_002866 [Serendipita sp. 405]KAG9044110.1 hypothetical protein FS842_001575 [Serendipita sp. 407]
MPTAIAPRYGTAPTNIPWLRNNSQNRFELSVSVQMNKPVTSISSPSHPIGLMLGCHQRELTGEYDPSKAFVYLGDSAMLDKDIVIVISAQGMDAPRCSVERWLKSDGAEETTDAYALTLVPKFELPALPSQEYIFLVDRSGSMAGSRIKAVRTALQILLRSLPSRGTSFNIVSFGSRYTSLWPTSQVYSAESMEQASKHVDEFEANYGGTELRSAIEFAFNSRQDIKGGSTDKTDTMPTSVFVLTDGEAWDLDGIINSINQSCGKAKKDGSLLRTFTLGVGNQVSTAMCEGIARAGKGTAVFVAEGEKPDAKLMGLLKAARGGVIDDLAVDWVDSEDAQDDDDEFEVIPSSKAGDYSEPSATSPPPQSQPPLSLFDESHVDTPAETGARKAIVFLDPPPKVQQAPKSDKLPIPLYPGFRCSIFAIVKRGSNPGPHSSNVKITGKVMGRDVVLQIPVSPVSVHSGLVEGKVEGGRLLHTLAAKALIQGFEDLPKTPENKAEIERLGKRYSLATSATSFVAIDEDTKDEIERKESQAFEPEEERSVKGGMDKLGRRPRQRPSAPAMVTGFDPTSIATGYNPSAATAGFNLSAMTTGLNPNSLSAGAEPAPLLRPSHSADARAVSPKIVKMQSDASTMTQPRKSGSNLSLNSGGLFGIRSVSPTASLSRPPRPQRVARMRYTDTRSDDPYARAVSTIQYTSSYSNTGYLDSPSVPPYTPPASISQQTLSVESIARAQNFDGSFPSDDGHLWLIVGADGLSRARDIPPALDRLAGGGIGAQAAMKKLIWATMLTIICLQKKFGVEKDSWEMLAEKAREYIEKELTELGLDESLVTQTVNRLETTASALF